VSEELEMETQRFGGRRFLVTGAGGFIGQRQGLGEIVAAGAGAES
jgi:FlaA1/EpsC-like NDP-sugar epimerase